MSTNGCHVSNATTWVRTTVMCLTLPRGYERLSCQLGRYRLPARPELGIVAAKQYARAYVAPIKVRVVNVLVFWVDRYFDAFDRSV